MQCEVLQYRDSSLPVNQIQSDIFPLSKFRSIKGSRRLAREKVMQILNAYYISDSNLNNIFTHVFFREFNFGEDEEKQEKILTQDEIVEIEADIPIHWEDDEIEFARLLIQNCIDLKDEVDTHITEIAENWELDRIAIIDRILIQMAATELLKFPEIPTKVSINEAIDIAKKYSTEKSGNFINGVLDTLLEQLKTKGKILKTGRGLKES